jgi:hypothetical protein
VSKKKIFALPLLLIRWINQREENSAGETAGEKIAGGDPYPAWE